jgi:hypothetical protein
MPDAHRNRTLNQALIILHRSLPMYLSHAAPWVAYGNDEAISTLDRIVADGKDGVRRLTELLNERRHTIELGEFPMDFTGLHDVAIDFLVKQLVSHQKHQVDFLESCAQRLAADYEGHSLVEEIANRSRRHLDSLQSLERQSLATKA